MQSIAIRVTCLSLLSFLCSAQRLANQAPASGVGAMDVYTAFKLPALKDGSGAPLDKAGLKLQVLTRAIALGLGASSATDAWNSAGQLLPDRPGPGASPVTRQRAVLCSTLPRLYQLLADATVTTIRMSGDLWLDAPLDVNRSGLTLDLTAATLRAPASVPWMIRIRGASGVSIIGGEFEAGDSAILIQNSDHVEVSDAGFRDLRGAGVVVSGSSLVRIARNRFNSLGLAPVILHGSTTRSIVETNTIQGNTGISNMSAGIVLTDREVDLSSGARALFGPDGYGPVPQPIPQRMHPPHDNAIFSNVVAGNLSSGIYSDGGVRNVFYGNIVRGNSKEGLCLDDGSTANVVAGNTITQNGQRWGDSDALLAREYIARGGRLPDGTAAAKVPGISIDNAIYNIVVGNHLEHNFGGGIKMVRTSYFNAIGLNSLLYNNDGEGPDFHFFGIELGAAAPNAPVVDLDFTPSRGNVIFSNLIRGNHFSGIYIGGGSDLNDIFGNTILDAEHWALESSGVMANSTVNNFTNLDSVNIASGLDTTGLK